MGLALCAARGVSVGMPGRYNGISSTKLSRCVGCITLTSGVAAGLPVWVSQQPRFFPFKTEDEVQAVYRKLDGVLDEKLPAMFTLLPKAKLDLRLEPELSRDTASDHYTAPAADGSRPGVFWSVVTDPAKYGSTGMTTPLLLENMIRIAIAARAEALGVPMLPGMTVLSSGDYKRREGIHWNQQGHRRISSVLRTLYRSAGASPGVSLP